jgi:hypothetical protein
MPLRAKSMMRCDDFPIEGVAVDVEGSTGPLQGDGHGLYGFRLEYGFVFKVLTYRHGMLL